MLVNGKPQRTIWLHSDGETIELIDQRRLPHEFIIEHVTNVEEAAHAIKDMTVRGAPLIGATAAYGMALAMRTDASDTNIEKAYDLLYATRPTAVNLRWALDNSRELLSSKAESQRKEAAYSFAAQLCEDDVKINSSIGDNGLELFRKRWEEVKALGGQRLNVLTHCNAGWLGCVDWGTALSPIYKAHDEGIPVHVWVDETRPRNQGASLTSWELTKHGVPMTLLVDNAGGHLMQHGLVDLCIVGTDRTTSTGDVCNKIGTYLKALAAHDNGVPFYVALPSSTIDWTIRDGVKEISIEERDDREVTHMRGRTDDGKIEEIAITLEGVRGGNYGFDVTPAKYVTAFITERGVCDASEEGLAKLFPEECAVS